MKKLLFLLTAVFLYAKGVCVGISYAGGVSNHTVTVYNPYFDKALSVQEKIGLVFFCTK